MAGDLIQSSLEGTKILGKKWAVTLIEEIAQGRFIGFNSTIQRLGNSITPRSLSMLLKELEMSEIIEKNKNKKDASNATRYNLTVKGVELYAILQTISRWGNKWN